MVFLFTFFIVEGKGWCAAAELKAGDILRTQDGETEIVEDVQIENLDETVKVYNLEIEDSHTYYVSADEVLVHNECGATEHPNGTYEDAPYHGKSDNAIKNKAPIDGQSALDNSVPISNTTSRRIGISEGEFVVLDETMEGLFHGHVRSWKELSNAMKAALRKAGLVNKKGKIL